MMELLSTCNSIALSSACSSLEQQNEVNLLIVAGSNIFLTIYGECLLCLSTGIIDNVINSSVVVITPLMSN